MGPCIVNVFLSKTNKMQRCTTFFITVNAVHVSGGFSAHHQELKNCKHSIGYMSSLIAATASGSSKQATEKPPEICRALTVIKNIVLRYIFLVILKKYFRLVFPSSCYLVTAFKILKSDTFVENTL